MELYTRPFLSFLFLLAGRSDTTIADNLGFPRLTEARWKKYCMFLPDKLPRKIRTAQKTRKALGRTKSTFFHDATLSLMFSTTRSSK